MAWDVHNTLKRIITTYDKSNPTPMEAEDYLQKLKLKQRYVLDIWA